MQTATENLSLVASKDVAKN